MRFGVWLALATGCPTQVPDEVPGPCEVEATGIDVAPPFGTFGELVDGSDLWFGNPPQGGAPYSPFRVRVHGPEAFEDGVTIEMSAVDAADGTELAWTSLTMGLTCANVGENEGYWVGSEAHMRYSGWSIADLVGRTALVTITASGIADPTVSSSATVEVILVTTET